MNQEQANPQPEAAERATLPAHQDKPKAASLTAPPLPEGTRYIWGTGRRKTAVARVRIRPGSGAILVNDRKVEEFFTEDKDRNAVSAPLVAANMVGSWDIWARVGGGGHSGQAGAVMLGLSRALIKAAPQTESALRDQGLLTRDARMKERKKYGQKGARKRFQYSKR